MRINFIIVFRYEIVSRQWSLMLIFKKPIIKIISGKKKLKSGYF